MDGSLTSAAAASLPPDIRTDERARGGMPGEQPLAMPAQDLRNAPPRLPFGERLWSALLARGISILGTLAITGYGVYEMLGIVGFSNMTVLQGVMILFFAITLAWIAFAAASALAALCAPRVRDDPAARLAESRTVLLMPIYNEDPGQTTAALQAMAQELARLDAAQHFEIAIVSDSTNADRWVAESIAVDELRTALRDTMPVWYRRRWFNTGRKAGNVEDFVKRWGGRYDYMIVMDADSIMSAQTLVTLVRRMQSDARLGILQTVPVLIGQWSVFARIQQFASQVYGRFIARGVGAWSGNEGNYWGHNAIIRVTAFATACGLPQLAGRRPFGGHILSHDFVEAALIRRAGWKVRMATDLDGSWEESPPSLVDIAVRDRRWAQGNLQHTKVVGAAGLTFTSRWHFCVGIMSYLSSPLWMMLLIVGFALTLQATLSRPEYFPRTFQLFPNWPVFDAPRMKALFIFTMIVLFVPKVLGLLRTLLSSRARRGCGGFIGVIASAVFETVISALHAPIMMLVQTQHVIEIITGRDSGWSAQRRSSLMTSWSEAWYAHWKHLLFGIAVATLAFYISVAQLAWLAPTLAGLLFAIPLSKLSGSVRTGRWLARLGLLRTPEEQAPPDVVRLRDEILAARSALPSDGLRFLARNPAARLTHIAGNLPRPTGTRGHPDSHRLTAAHKVEEAHSLGELLGWLSPAERVHVAGDPLLLERLAALPD